MTIDQITFRAADAAVPDLLVGSGTAAVSSTSPATTTSTALVEVTSETSSWNTSRPWAGARVVPLDPAAAATGWLSALLVRRDWTTLWSTTDPNLRLAMAQQWLAGLGSTGDNISAWSLAAEVPHIGMWGPFADQLFSSWCRLLTPAMTSGQTPDMTPGNHRTGDDLRVQGPTDRHQFGRRGGVGGGSAAGRELWLIRTGEDVAVPHLTLRLRDRWRVAGIGAGVMQPGWPARWLDLDGSDADVTP